jgi:anti-sigma regulatory factor (Ser/Thr protein kinase)
MFADPVSNKTEPPLSPREARAARSAFADVLRANGDRSSDFVGAELIFGELVGNVAQHAPGPVEVSLDWKCRYPILTVCDHRKAFPASSKLPANDYQEHGRGLPIVKILAREMSVTDVPGDGTRVTVQLPVRRSRAA